MKIISLILCFCLSGQVLAGVKELEQGLDEYQYAITVEWDQQDKKFYQEKTQAFFKHVQQALSEGVSKEQVLALAEKKTKNSANFEALKLKMNLLSKQASTPAELAELIKLSAADFYSQGASWNGEVVLLTGLGIVFAALIGYAIWWNIKYECVAYETHRECDWVTENDGDRDYECWDERDCVEWVERKK